MGIPMRQGREYNDTDTLQSPRTLVINEAMAQRYWPEGNALGGRIRLGQNLAEVIGIVADSKYSSINERPLPQLFFPMSRSETSTLRLFVKHRRRSRADGRGGPQRDSRPSMRPCRSTTRAR